MVGFCLPIQFNCRRSIFVSSGEFTVFQLLLLIIYLSFISLGLPDGLLGAAWPSIYPELGLPVSYAGIVSMIIAAGTVVSSLQSDRLTRRFGTGKVTAFSVSTGIIRVSAPA